MEQKLGSSLTLKASKGPYILCFVLCGIFFLTGVGARFPEGWLFLLLKLLAIPFCIFGMIVFLVGILTNRYVAVLDEQGIIVSTFSSKRKYLWQEITSIYVLRETTRRRVCIEVARKESSGKIHHSVKNLPSTYGFEAYELTTTLLQRRREHGTFKTN